MIYRLPVSFGLIFRHQGMRVLERLYRPLAIVFPGMKLPNRPRLELVEDDRGGDADQSQMPLSDWADYSLSPKLVQRLQLLENEGLIRGGYQIVDLSSDSIEFFDGWRRPVIVTEDAYLAAQAYSFKILSGPKNSGLSDLDWVIKRKDGAGTYFVITRMEPLEGSATELSDYFFAKACDDRVTFEEVFWESNATMAWPSRFYCDAELEVFRQRYQEFLIFCPEIGVLCKFIDLVCISLDGYRNSFRLPCLNSLRLNASQANLIAQMMPTYQHGEDE